MLISSDNLNSTSIEITERQHGIHSRAHTHSHMMRTPHSIRCFNMLAGWLVVSMPNTKSTHRYTKSTRYTERRYVPAHSIGVRCVFFGRCARHRRIRCRFLRPGAFLRLDCNSADAPEYSQSNAQHNLWHRSRPSAAMQTGKNTFAKHPPSCSCRTPKSPAVASK